MINIMYLVLTAILALNVSAEVINAFKVVNSSLENSNANITTSTQSLYTSFKEKLTDPTAPTEKVKYWKDKADQVEKLSSDMNDYLETLKKELKTAAEVKMVTRDGRQVEEYRYDNLDAATRVFDKQGKGDLLQQALIKYKADVLAVDPAIKLEFENKLPIDVNAPVSQEGTQKTFTQTFFHMTPTVAAMTMLSKFQNGVKNSENQVVTYCHSQIGAVKFVYDKFAALVGQSSNYVMPGQEIQITAGVGSYSSKAQPQITINGAGAALDADGRALYKFNASGAGNHTVPVVVRYTTPDGKQESKSFNVEYTVGTPGGSAVMLDKMNVFYIGVPNPITISSGTGWDKTHVSMSGGSLSPAGGPGKFIIKVSSVGKASISVNADGKNSTYDFRVKRIPDPVFMVGQSKGGRMQSVIFKNQQYCRADLENFDFDARFTVVGATVYFSGANFSSVQTAQISSNSLAPLAGQLAKCIPGTSITFDNVKVQGPDGTTRTIQGPGFILF